MVKAGYKRSARAAVVAVCLVALSHSSWAGDSRPVDVVKEALIYNFTKFVQWDPSPAAFPGRRFRLCILGKDRFGEAFDRKLAERTIGGKPIMVLRANDLAQLETCNLLFVSSSEEAALSKVIGSTVGSPVLTIGETQGFFDAGGIIRLVVENNKVRFDINAAAAKRAGLKISSQLLKLARDVRM